MAKRIYLFLLISLTTLNVLNAQMFDFSAKDAVKLHGRKLIVVLQEEDENILFRIKKDPAKVARYKAVIAYSNNLLKKAVSTFWRTGQKIEFRKVSECQAMSDTSQSYITLEFTSLRVNENTQLYQLKPDTNNVYPIRTTLISRKEYGYFDLKLIEKFRGAAFYTFYIPASVPNEFDFITAIQFTSKLVKEKLKDVKFSSRDFEKEIQASNWRLFKRILLADSNIVNKQAKSYAFIRREYDSLSIYELSEPKDISQKVYTKDTVYAYLNIVPYIDPLAKGSQSYLGSTGGNINDYDKTVYFMQLIIDAHTGEVLYYDKTQEYEVIHKDWRRFLRFAKEDHTPIFQQQKKVEQSPQQKYYQNQYQPNQY